MLYGWSSSSSFSLSANFKWFSFKCPPIWNWCQYSIGVSYLLYWPLQFNCPWILSLAIHAQRFWPKQSSEPITEPAGLPVPRPKQWPTMILKPSGPSFSHSGSRSFTSFSPMGDRAKVGINPHFRCSILCSQAIHIPSFSDTLYVQKRALEMVESSRDPNMLTKIQELSRQVGIVFVFFLSYTRRVAFFLF